MWKNSSTTSKDKKFCQTLLFRLISTTLSISTNRNNNLIFDHPLQTFMTVVLHRLKYLLSKLIKWDFVWSEPMNLSLSTKVILEWVKMMTKMTKMKEKFLSSSSCPCRNMISYVISSKSLCYLAKTLSKEE